MIDPPEATELTIYFTSFNTEEEYDVVQIYDLETQDLLAEYSGDIIADPVTSPSGRMFVTFSSNYTITAPGWEAYYETDLVSIVENESIRNFQLYPNPTSNLVNLSWYSDANSYSKVSITDLSGKILILRDMTSKEGNNKLELDVSELSNGIYLIELVSESKKVQRKLIIQ